MLDYLVGQAGVREEAGSDEDAGGGGGSSVDSGVPYSFCGTNSLCMDCETSPKVQKIRVLQWEMTLECTFVSLNGRENPLLVAGGGGGTRGHESDGDGQDASLEEDGLAGGGPQGSFGAAGTGGGAGETAGGGWGGGGAGYFGSNGEIKSFVDFDHTTTMHKGGGIGGGGEAATDGGGGGGGYSGGGGASSAGGGGSFVAEGGTDVEKAVGHKGDGELIIETDISTPAPEPEVPNHNASVYLLQP